MGKNILWAGEQGALNMMPMFLIDHGMIAADVGVWTGVVGQAVSIAGSVVGGMVVSSQRYCGKYYKQE